MVTVSSRSLGVSTIWKVLFVIYNNLKWKINLAWVLMRILIFLWHVYVCSHREKLFDWISVVGCWHWTQMWPYHDKVVVVSTKKEIVTSTSGNDPIWRSHILQMGWFNHHPDDINGWFSNSRETDWCPKDASRLPIQCLPSCATNVTKMAMDAGAVQKPFAASKIFGVPSAFKMVLRKI